MNQSGYTPILLALLGVLLFSLLDAVMKALALEMGTYNAMFWRMVFGVAFVLVLYFPRGKTLPTPSVFKLHLGRAVLTTVMTYLFFFSLTRLPLAQAIGLSFIAPIIALFLAPPLLNERIGSHAVLAAGLGFCGVLVVISGELRGTGSSSDTMGLAAVLMFALLYAFYLVLQRRHALVAKPLEIVFYQNILVFTVLLLAAPFAVSPPSEPGQLGVAALAAALSIGSLGLMSMAYRRAEAQRLVTIEYTAFIWAALLGWWYFEEAVTLETLLGTGLIVLGCLLSARKPGRKNADLATPGIQ